MARRQVASLLFLLAVIVLAISHDAPARTWTVEVDGSGDAPTLQAAVDSALDGDLILVAPGTYTWTNQGGGVEAGMIFIPETAADLSIVSEGGPGVTVLDGQNQGRILAHQGETDLTVEGFTFVNGVSTAWGENFGGAFLSHKATTAVRDCVFRYNHGQYGGALCYAGTGSITVEDCLFEFNTASHRGGAVFLINSPSTGAVSVFLDCILRNNECAGGSFSTGGAVSAYNLPFRLEGCTLYNNEVSGQGGAVASSQGGTNELFQCTIAQNAATSGGAVAAVQAGSLSLEACILIGNVGSDPVYVDATSAAVLSCCDVVGNVPGNWTGSIADQEGLNGNFSADPVFCAGGDPPFGLHRSSPCLPGNHPSGDACGRIGSQPKRCGAIPIAVRETSWGEIKSLFRDRP
jgi:hypothetical protein